MVPQKETDIANEATTSAYAIHLGIKPEAQTQFGLKPQIFDKLPANLPPTSRDIFQAASTLLRSIQQRDALEPRPKYKYINTKIADIEPVDSSSFEGFDVDKKKSVIQNEINNKVEKLKKGGIVLVTIMIRGQKLIQ